jgi:hypothetical protein
LPRRHETPKLGEDEDSTFAPEKGEADASRGAGAISMQTAARWTKNESSTVMTTGQKSRDARTIATPELDGMNGLNRVKDICA